jgi:hypothetical protein
MQANKNTIGLVVSLSSVLWAMGFALLSIIGLSACTDSKTAATPPAAATENTPSDQYQTDDESDSNADSDDNYDDDDDSEDPDDDNSDFTGADIGTETTKQEVSECNGKGKFYDRYANDGEGECKSAKIAKTECSVENLTSLLKGSEKAAFESAVEGAYDGFEIDQCLDCPKNNSIELCTASDGAKQTGTKVFFVKESAEEIRGKARLLSIRPGQSSSASDEEEE